MPQRAGQVGAHGAQLVLELEQALGARADGRAGVEEAGQAPVDHPHPLPRDGREQDRQHGDTDGGPRQHEGVEGGHDPRVCGARPLPAQAR